MRFTIEIQLIQKLIKAVSIVFLYTSCFWISSAYALTPPDVGTMLQNFSKTVPQLMQLVTALAYVLGIVFCLKGVVGLKAFGESRTHHEGGGAKGPLIMLAVGAALLYLPGSVRTGVSTFWDVTAAYSYLPKSTSSSPWSGLIVDVFTIIQLVGTIAFIRGLIMLTKLGGHGGGQASLGKAMTHMIAGIFCINMYQFVQTIMNTLALGQI